MVNNGLAWNGDRYTAEQVAEGEIPEAAAIAFGIKQVNTPSPPTTKAVTPPIAPVTGEATPTPPPSGGKSKKSKLDSKPIEGI